MGITDEEVLRVLKQISAGKSPEFLTIGFTEVYNSAAFLKMVKFKMEACGPDEDYLTREWIYQLIMNLKYINNLFRHAPVIREAVESTTPATELKSNATKAISHLKRAAVLMGLRENFFFAKANPDNTKLTNFFDGQYRVELTDSKAKIIKQSTALLNFYPDYTEPPRIIGETPDEKELRQRTNLWNIRPLHHANRDYLYESRREAGPQPKSPKRAILTHATKLIWRELIAPEWRATPSKYSTYSTIANLVSDFTDYVPENTTIQKIIEKG